VQLSCPVWELLEALPLWSDEDHYLLSSQSGHRAIAGFSQGKARLDALAEKHLRDITGQPSARMKYFRVHDLRVTCETRLATLGFYQEVRDAMLGHAKPGLQKTYNKHDYLEEKREALEAFARVLMWLWVAETGRPFGHAVDRQEDVGGYYPVAGDEAPRVAKSEAMEFLNDCASCLRDHYEVSYTVENLETAVRNIKQVAAELAGT
jgi:hypothetical protein